MGTAVCRGILVVLLTGACAAAVAAAPDSGARPVGSFPQRLEAGIAAFDRRAYPQALEILTPLARDAERARDRATLTRAVYYSGRSHYFLTDYRTALPMMQRALALAQEAGDRAFEAEVWRGVGRLHKQQGTYAEGMVACEKSIALFEALGERREAGRTWLTVGAIHDLRGEFEAALAAYERARIAMESVHDIEYYTLFNEVGITYTNLGRYEDALAAHRVSLEGREKSGDPYLIGISHSNIGDVYTAYGQYERAMEHYLLCLQMCGARGDRRTMVITLQQLTRISILMGNATKAKEYAERQIQLAREHGLEPLEGVALRQMGDVQRMLGDVAASRSFHEQALARARKTSAHSDEAHSLLSLAELAMVDGDAARAHTLASQGLGIAETTRAPDLEIEARVLLARAARANGKRKEALEQLRASVATIDDVRGSVRTDAGKIGYLDTRQSAYQFLALTLEETGDTRGALEAAEAARGRAFSDLLAAQRVSLKAADAREIDGIRALEARLRAESSGDPGLAVTPELLATRAAGKATFDGKLRQLRNEQPEVASLVSASPPAVGDIAGVARRLDATLVEYLVTEERVLAWVVAPDGRVESRGIKLPREQLRTAVRELQEHMNHLTRQQLGADPVVRDKLARLHAWVLAPVEALLPRDPQALVMVIPHDALHLVPYAALRDERGAYALQRHTIAYAPAAAVLKYTEPKKSRAISPAKPHFLGLADPALPKDVVQAALPGAREEIHGAARRFAVERRLTLAGADATEASLKRLAPAQTVLHLAVHGLARDDRPWESALLLAPGEGDDGWLKLPEIFGLDLHADLVVLSGCSTGLGRISGDGIVGLARAVIYAGTPSVIVSQWDISDRSTAFLMERFYAERARGHGKAAALRSAQLATLDRHSHPALWAPFALVGEP